MSRGNFYAYAVEVSAAGNRVAREVARQAPSFQVARAALDATGLPGYVQRWSDAAQIRFVAATRRADGTWFSTDPFTGREIDFDTTAVTR